MVKLEYSIHRVKAFLDEIERLKHSDLPYKSTRYALGILENKFKDHFRSLNRLIRLSPPPDVSVINTSCTISLTDIYIYLPILGFILRSTSVRNAFETYGPLRRLVRNILEPNFELILSSEWEYSPYTYSKIPILPNFVLIGLPAQESENPFLLPLSGHELGHSVWSANNLEFSYTKDIEDKISHEIKNTYWRSYHEFYPQYKKEDLKNDLFARDTWMPAYEIALRQIEEIFCDLMGLRIFAESYLHAMSYLLSPCISGKRSLHYPNVKRCISHLEEGADHYSINIPDNYLGSFEDNGEPNEPLLRLLVQIADSTSTDFLTRLIDEVSQITNDKGIPERSHDNVDKIIDNFMKLVPIMDENSLSDILNAAWRSFHDDQMWKDTPNINSKNRIRVLRELTLKSIEVIEIKERLK